MNTQILYHHFGETIMRALADKNVTEIIVNADGRLWIESHTRGMEPLAVTYPTATREAIITAIASLLGTIATKEHPILEGELPGTYYRFAGTLPPVTVAPQFVIRKHDAHELTLDSYIADGILTEQQAEILTHEIIDKQSNCIISGATRSGKTTLANALLNHLALLPALRLCVVEDTRELHCRATNATVLRANKDISLRDLTRHALRLRPDRIIIGEVRGPEAIDLLNAWNSGHRGGLATLHCNGVASVFLRLQTCIAQDTNRALPLALFAEAVNFLVHIHHDGTRRRVTEMARVVPVGDSYTLECISSGGSHE